MVITVMSRVIIDGSKVLVENNPKIGITTAIFNTFEPIIFQSTI